MNERYENALELFKEAKREIREGRRNAAISSFIRAFYLRNTESNFIDLHFTCFFRYQFAKYLELKKSLMLSLSEGDMISDLIHSAYDDFMLSLDDSPFKISNEGIDRLLSMVDICFPCQDDSENDESQIPVSF